MLAQMVYATDVAWLMQRLSRVSQAKQRTIAVGTLVTPLGPELVQAVMIAEQPGAVTIRFNPPVKWCISRQAGMRCGGQAEHDMAARN